jgi:hypothetical protein
MSSLTESLKPWLDKRKWLGKLSHHQTQLTTNGSTMNMPPFIALCGNPHSGKSTVQLLLKKLYGVVPVDDGYPLREFAVNNLGLTWQQVTTEDGKREIVELLGRTWTVREILGEFGNRVEDMLGPNGIPLMAINRTKTMKGESFCFGSVRRDQGVFIKEHGGVVIGIENPIAGPSIYEFDRFNHDAVDVWLNNDAQSHGLDQNAGLYDLELKIRNLFESNFEITSSRAIEI